MTVKELARVPDPFDTIERWTQFTYRDLPRYTRGALQVERARIRWLILTIDDRPCARNESRLDWLASRLAQVEARLQ